MMVNPINLEPIKIHNAASEGIGFPETLCSIGCNITGNYGMNYIYVEKS